MITSMTNGKLKEMFPQHESEIESLSGIPACGCSGCTWKILKEKHPELELPDEVHEFAIWC